MISKISKHLIMEKFIYLSLSTYSAPSPLLSKEVIKSDTDEIPESYWIFGYGSLIWKTNFPFAEKKVGYIKGYGRRFWQASHDHRGTKVSPGRVVTLVSNENEITWGIAYRIDPNDWNYVINNLNTREIDGYSAQIIPFYSYNNNDIFNINVWVYVAFQDNTSFLGDAPIEEIVNQIFNSKGESGSNLEYLLNLAQALREIGSHAIDNHTLELEKSILKRLDQEAVR